MGADFGGREPDAIDDSGHMGNRFKVAFGKVCAERFVQRFDFDFLCEEKLRKDESQLAR